MDNKAPATFAYAWTPRPDEDDVPLAEAYLKAVSRVESMPRNQSGEDKSWVEIAIDNWERHYRQAVRVR